MSINLDVKLLFNEERLTWSKLKILLQKRSKNAEINMKAKYTAKIYFENDETAEHSADDIQQLITWMQTEAKTHSSEINGEIFDNTTHRIVKNIQYNPFEK